MTRAINWPSPRLQLLQPWVRIAFPSTLALLGIYLLTGCIYIPMFGRTIEGTNAASKVGPGTSNKSLRVGVATRDHVIALLGRPWLESEDGSVFAYTWQVQNGLMAGLCFYEVKGRRTLILRFDESGVLNSFDILKADDPAIQFSATYRKVLLPPDLTQQLLDHRARTNYTLPDRFR